MCKSKSVLDENADTAEFIGFRTRFLFHYASKDSRKKMRNEIEIKSDSASEQGTDEIKEEYCDF